jgi:Uncharacterized protein, putative amidase
VLKLPHRIPDVKNYKYEIDGGIIVFSYNSTADEIVNGNVDVVILPIGSTEQHGPHLPIATDFLIAEDIGERIAEELGALLLPVLPIATCLEHRGKKGSVWIKPVNFYNSLCDIVMCLKGQGFKKIILLNSHGGNFILGPAVRDLNASNEDIKVVLLNLENFFSDIYEAGLLECRDNLHACEYETSLMLYLHEELVRKERIEDCIPDVPRNFLNYEPLLKYSKNGVWGMPSLASKEKGEKIFKLLVEKSLVYLRSIV